jgi:hypothetical protein
MKIERKNYNTTLRVDLIEKLTPKIKDYPGQHIKLKIDNADLDFAEAKDIAKQKDQEGKKWIH